MVYPSLKDGRHNPTTWGRFDVSHPTPTRRARLPRLSCLGRSRGLIREANTHCPGVSIVPDRLRDFLDRSHGSTRAHGDQRQQTRTHRGRHTTGIRSASPRTIGRACPRRRLDHTRNRRRCWLLFKKQNDGRNRFSSKPGNNRPRPGSLLEGRHRHHWTNPGRCSTIVKR
jgi:hypothetical protein